MQSVLEIHEKVSEVLNHSSKKLQTLENFKVQLEEEVKTLKKQLGITKKGNTFCKFIYKCKFFVWFLL